MFDVNGRVVVITGAGGEICSAIAHCLADSGAHLVLSDIDDERLETLAGRLPKETSFITERHDVASAEDADRLYQACESTFGHVDGIVTGAGLYEHLSLTELTAAQWRRCMAVNLDGVFYTIQALRPLLSENSTIVNIASHAGHQGSVDHTPYAAAKGGVLALTRSLAKELAPRTRVNAVSPGLIDTEMLASLESERRDAMTAGTPMKRLGTAEEVAEAVAFLCSSRSGFMTAATLHINGGLYIAS